MKKNVTFFLPFFAVILFSSCITTKKSYLPQVTNMVKAVSFDELNLTSNDYVILDRIEATARVDVTITSSNIIVEDPDGLFKLTYAKNKQTGSMEIANFEGVVRAGYLTRDLSMVDSNNPEEIASKMAVYRLINLVREQGGDGVIEPVIATNFEGMSKEGLMGSKTRLTYVATVSGKIIRLKNSK